MLNRGVGYERSTIIFTQASKNLRYLASICHLLCLMIRGVADPAKPHYRIWPIDFVAIPLIILLSQRLHLLFFPLAFIYLSIYIVYILSSVQDY